MATKSKKKGKTGRGNDVLTITKADWKGGKGKFPTAASGKYRFRFHKKSSIKPGSNGNVLNLISTLTAMHNGKKSEYKGINVFDNIAPHVGWKIAQVLRAMKIKKVPKKMTLKELLSLILKYKGEIRIVIGKKMFNGKPQNPVLQYLPLGSDKDEDDDDTEEDEDEEEDEDSDDEDSDEDDEDSDDEDDDEDEDEEDDEDEDEEDEDEDEDEDDDDDDDDEDEEDDDDDDEDEEEERPKRRAKKSKAKKGKAKSKRRS